MITNYLKIALRNLWKTKGITAINIIGLSVGLACFALVGLYVLDEFTFDRFHTNADRIFRVARLHLNESGGVEDSDPFLPMPLGPAMQADFPEVENYVRIGGFGESFVRTNHLTAKQERFILADPSLFQVFSFPLLYGDPQTALRETNSVVLSEKAALRFFGEPNPVGRSIDIKFAEQFEPFTVTGIAKDIPSNSSIDFDFLLPFEKIKVFRWAKNAENNWRRSSIRTFVQLRPGASLPKDAGRLLQFYQKYYPNELKELRDKGQWKSDGPPITYALQPLRSIHFDTETGGTIRPASNSKYAWILLAIGGMLLLIACINFTTLAIGRSAGRAREIGLRKVIGARRSQLVGQFLAEAVLLSACSMGLAMILMKGLLPVLNDISEKNLAFDTAVFPEIKWLVPGLILLTGLLAGFYPALVMSGLKPIAMLQQKLRLTGSNAFTKSLVVFQFVLSVGLVACTGIMLRQVDFLKSKSPGFDKEQVVVMPIDGPKGRDFLQALRQQLGDRSEFSGFTGSDVAFGAGEGWSRSGFDYNGTDHKDVYEYSVDPAFIPVLGMQLVAGRNFDFSLASDTFNAVIINEEMARSMNWDKPLGQVLTGYNETEPQRNPVVIGVVKDFNFRSLHHPVEPMMFTSNGQAGYTVDRVLTRVQAGKNQAALALLGDVWKQYNPEIPFQYGFLDEKLGQFYKAEDKWSQILGIAGAIAIILACLGLFGLTALAVVNRTKEIGIRKVLGASISGIAALLARDVVKLVLIAIVLATPVALWVTQQWLQSFAYRIEPGWWIFAGAGAVAVLVAVATVSVHGVRAALADPVKSLRSE